MTRKAALAVALLVAASLAGCLSDAGGAAKATLAMKDRPDVKSDPRAKETTWKFRVWNNGTVPAPASELVLTVDLLGEITTASTTLPALAPGEEASVNLTTPYQGWGDYRYLVTAKAGATTLLSYRGFYEYCGFPC